MPNVNDDDEETLHFADESEYMQEPEETDEDFKSGANPGDCPQCAPFACDDPDMHLGPPPGYGPPPGCHCNAWSTGADCMCFEGPF